MDLHSLLFAGVLLLTATFICVSVFKRLRLGSVLGFIAAGILVGPYSPGPVVTSNVNELRNLTEIGVVLFLFTIGLEMRPEKLWSMRNKVFGLGTLQVVITAAVLATYGLVALQASWKAALILGLGLALSSTAIVMMTLGESGEIGTEHGRTSFAILLLQDLAIVPMLMVVPLLATTTVSAEHLSGWPRAFAVVAIIAAVIVAGRFILPPLLGWAAARRDIEAFTIITYLSVLAAAWSVETVGVSMNLGAFLMGMLLSASHFRHQLESTVASFKGILLGLFFISVGMSIDISALLEDWSGILFDVVTLLILKSLILLVICVPFQVSRPATIRTAFLLSQAGEFGFVLFGAAVASGLMGTRLFTVALLLISLSMMLTPVMVRIGDRLAKRFTKHPAAHLTLDGALETSHDHVVVVGCGRVGQLICQLLEKSGISYTALDRDFNLVIDAKSNGFKAYYGDIRDHTLQTFLGLERAAAVVFSLSDFSRTDVLLTTLRSQYPHIPLHARATTFAQAEELIGHGAKTVSPVYVEGTLAFGSKILGTLGLTDNERVDLVDAFRRNDYALIRHPDHGPKL